MRTFAYDIAVNDVQILDAQRLRWTVYAEEECMLSGESSAVDGTGTPRLIDGSDRSSATAHVLVYAGPLAVGTARLTVLGNSGESTQSTTPVAAPFAVEGLPGTARLGLVERFCVLRHFRGTGVTPALYRGLGAESRRRGVTHWLALANSETDCAQDATLAYRVVQAEGLVSTQVRARALAVPCPRAACSRHIFSARQREEAHDGSLAGMRLPRTLALFARRMNGRYVGPPVYDTQFRIFAFPIVAEPPVD